MTIENTYTKLQFERRFGTSRRVIICKKSGQDLLPGCAGEVVRFCPDEKLEVHSVETGKLLTVHLSEVVPDKDYINIEDDESDEHPGSQSRAGLKRRGRKLARLSDSDPTTLWRRKKLKLSKVRRRPKA